VHSLRSHVTDRPAHYPLSLHDALPILPPPPRIAQNKSGLDSWLAWSCLPSTVTTCAESRLSHAAPNFSIRRPSPPPSVKPAIPTDRKSTRLNSSHRTISYAVFCLKKKK